MIALAGVAILAVYTFATFGILAAIKTDDVSIVTGIVDALQLQFDAVLGGYDWLFDLAVVGLLFTFFGNMVTWSIGANQTIGATGLDKTAPGVFGHVNKRFGTPDYAFVLMGVIATAITVLAYALDPEPGERLLDAVRPLVDRVPDPVPADVPGAARAAAQVPRPTPAVRRAGRHGRRLDQHGALRGRHRS